MTNKGFPGGPMVKNLPCNAGDSGLIPGGGTKIPHTLELLSLQATTRESERCNEIFPHDATKIPCTVTKTGGSQINIKNK